MRQFLITLLLVGVYVGAIIAALAAAAPETGKLPDISRTFINLLALSHAGYLAYKVAPKAGADEDTTPDDGRPRQALAGGTVGPSASDLTGAPLAKVSDPTGR